MINLFLIGPTSNLRRDIFDDETVPFIDYVNIASGTDPDGEEGQEVEAASNRYNIDILKILAELYTILKRQFSTLFNVIYSMILSK